MMIINSLFSKVRRQFMALIFVPTPLPPSTLCNRAMMQEIMRSVQLCPDADDEGLYQNCLTRGMLYKEWGLKPVRQLITQLIEKGWVEEVKHFDRHDRLARITYTLTPLGTRLLTNT